jgi:hypothetical protein
MLNLQASLCPQSFMQLLDLKLMLFLKFLETEIGSGLVITHVVVPGSRKLQELAALCTFNRYQFLLLGLSHVLEQTQHLLVPQVFEFQLRFSGLGEVQLIATLLAVVVQQPSNP